MVGKRSRGKLHPKKEGQFGDEGEKGEQKRRNSAGPF